MYCHKALFAKLVLAAWLSCSLGAIAAIPVATGSGVGALPTPQPPFFDITTFGAVSGGPAVANQTAINNAINAASAAGGGTVVVPAGDFKTFSIAYAQGSSDLSVTVNTLTTVAGTPVTGITIGVGLGAPSGAS